MIRSVIKSALVVVAVIVVSLLWSSFYIVPETEQVVITAFGKPVGEPVGEPVSRENPAP